MLVQLNRTDQNRAFAPNAAPAASAPGSPAVASPVGAARTPDLNGPRPDPVVVVLGYAGRAAGLAAHLPGGWAVRAAATPGEVRRDEIVLLSGAVAGDVERARTVLPRGTAVVALVDEDAPADQVAAVLTAGADACVRGGQPAILAGHLVACRRRQLANRWMNLERTFPNL